VESLVLWGTDRVHRFSCTCHEFAGSGLIAVVVWAGEQISVHLLNAREVFGIVETLRVTAVLWEGSLHTLGCCVLPIKGYISFFSAGPFWLQHHRV